MAFLSNFDQSYQAGFDQENVWEEDDEVAETEDGVNDCAQEASADGNIASVTDEVSGFATRFAASTYGDDIDSGIASSLQYLLNTKLPEKPLKDILEKYETPANAKNLCVPKVNTQIWDSLRPHSRNNDLKLQNVENLMVKGITAFTKNLPLKEDQENGLTCLAAAVFEMNMLRREFIKPGLQEKFAPLCKSSVPVTENLFGDELSKTIKDIDEVNKVTGKMARQQRFAPYVARGRGRGGNQSSFGRGGNQSFLGRGGNQPFRQQNRPYRGTPPAFKRGRGRAGRGQQQQQQ
jgi:hypothetical protein